MKKGYTLVELLAVIIILAAILSIVALNVAKIFNSRKQVDYDNIVMLIEENTKTLVNTDTRISVMINDKLQSLQESGSSDSFCNLNYLELVDANLMDVDTKNPITNKIIDSNSYITISLNSSNNYNYHFVYNENNTNMENNCLQD